MKLKQLVGLITALLLFAIITALLLFAISSNARELYVPSTAARARMLPVRGSYRLDDDCVLVFQNYTNKNLALTITAIDETSKRTNTCLVDLAGGTTKEIDLLKDWILTPDDRVRVEMVNPQ